MTHRFIQPVRTRRFNSDNAVDRALRSDYVITAFTAQSGFAFRRRTGDRNADGKYGYRTSSGTARNEFSTPAPGSLISGGSAISFGWSAKGRSSPKGLTCQSRNVQSVKRNSTPTALSAGSPGPGHELGTRAVLYRLAVLNFNSSYNREFVYSV